VDNVEGRCTDVRNDSLDALIRSTTASLTVFGASFEATLGRYVCNTFTSRSPLATSFHMRYQEASAEAGESLRYSRRYY
jgi:hypothetical protein